MSVQLPPITWQPPPQRQPTETHESKTIKKHAASKDPLANYVSQHKDDDEPLAYYIIESSSEYEISKRVVDMMIDGWTPQGGITAFYNKDLVLEGSHNEGEFVFHQAMIKETDIEKYLSYLIEYRQIPPPPRGGRRGNRRTIRVKNNKKKTLRNKNIHP